MSYHEDLVKHLAVYKRQAVGIDEQGGFLH
jgi:hypothetical protein